MAVLIWKHEPVTNHLEGLLTCSSRAQEEAYCTAQLWRLLGIAGNGKASSDCILKAHGKFDICTKTMDMAALRSIVEKPRGTQSLAQGPDQNHFRQLYFGTTSPANISRQQYYYSWLALPPIVANSSARPEPGLLSVGQELSCAQSHQAVTNEDCLSSSRCHVHGNTCWRQESVQHLPPAILWYTLFSKLAG